MTTKNDNTQPIGSVVLSYAILKILHDESGSGRKLTIPFIKKALAKKGIHSTDKTIRGHLRTLQQVEPLGRGVRQDANGWSIDAFLDASQLRLLSDGLLEDRINPEERAEIVARLKALVGKGLRDNIDFLENAPAAERTERNYLSNVAELDKAISRGCAVACQRCRWNRKGELAPVRVNGKPEEYVVYPYQMVFKDGHRYLIFLPEGVTFLDYMRVDKLHSVTLRPELRAAPLAEVLEGGENADLAYWQDELIGFKTPAWPMPVHEFKVRVKTLEPLFDEFPEARIKPCEGGFEATFAAVPERVFRWALQPLSHAEVIEPEIDRKRIARIANSLAETYADE